MTYVAVAEENFLNNPELLAIEEMVEQHQESMVQDIMEGLSSIQNLDF